MTVPEGLVHGRNSRACRIYRCDCKACLPSGKRRPEVGTPQKERNRQLRERKWGTPVPEGTRHGRYAYRTYGCRCDVCVAAQEASRPRAESTAVERNDVTVMHWPPIGEGMWECPVCHEKFPHRSTL